MSSLKNCINVSKREAELSLFKPRNYNAPLTFPLADPSDALILEGGGGCAIAQEVCRQLSAEVWFRFIWDFWLAKWHWNRFFSVNIHFTLWPQKFTQIWWDRTKNLIDDSCAVSCLKNHQVLLVLKAVMKYIESFLNIVFYILKYTPKQKVKLSHYTPCRRLRGE